jgi:hypothetical protein
MRRYMHEHGVSHAAFAPFVTNAPENALLMMDALLRFPVSGEAFAQAK